MGKELHEESLSEAQQAVAQMIKDLADIYKNKSSDEYKMMGDITKSPMYENIETSVANLKTLKGFPSSDADDYQNLFNTLHKPMYKKMVTEFCKEPNERNTTFTAIFTAGYRTLVGDMALIFASTEATENGIVYKPGKAGTQNPLRKKYVKDMCRNAEEEYNKVLRQRENRPKMHQEFFTISRAIGSAVSAIASLFRANEVGPITSLIHDALNHIFGARKELNPVSWISHRLTDRYDQQVHRLKDVTDLYEENLKAYNEYKNKAGRKSMAVEGRYLRNIKRYNIQMKNLQARLAHYDSRAQAQAEEKLWKERQDKLAQKRAEREAKKANKDADSKPSPKPTSSSSSDDDKPKPAPKPTTVDTGDLDF